MLIYPDKILNFMTIKNVIKSTVLVVFIFKQSFSQINAPGFKQSQLKNARVKTAYDEKWPALQSDLKDKKLDPVNFDVYLRVFKQEKEIQVWMKNTSETTYKLFRTYAVCASSGSLGPKRKEGDGQVPEGFYKIDLFNPTSNYYLSLRVSYPNSSDLILKEGANAGGAIMVHGNCVTIGCLPITDDKIKELYVLCVEAQNRKRLLTIDIFPAKLTESNMTILRANYSKADVTFWNSLKPRYTYFEKNNAFPEMKIDKRGAYIYNN